MNKKLFGMMSLALLGAATANAAGFALYGGSTKGMAMGGAVTGKAVDASANFYNPATISDFDTTVITLGSGIEIPRADIKVMEGPNMFNGGHGKTTKTHLDAGTFILPHFYVVQPLGAGFTFGLGGAAEYGLGSEYGGGWAMDWDTNRTMIEGFVINPNLSYAVTEDWSVSGGFRLLYFSFDQTSNPIVGVDSVSHLPVQGHNHLKADNNFSDWGWTVSTRYKILDNLSAGIMYRSYIDTRVRGKSKTRVSHPNTIAGAAPVPLPDYMIASAATGRGGADLRLPQSITAGLNWDVTETVHLGASVTYTRWSSMKTLTFNIPPTPHPVHLNWDDVFRFGFGAAWDFAENWTLMGSYVFDMDPCSTKRNEGSTMLPSGDRHCVATGLAYRWGNWELAGTYGVIFMDCESQKFTDKLGREYKFSAHAGYSHQGGITLSYYF